jgi:hypothetical protein
MSMNTSAISVIVNAVADRNIAISGQVVCRCDCDKRKLGYNKMWIGQC